MNDGVFGANSGQKKALGGDGVFDGNSGARKATGGELAKVDNGKGSALAQHVREGAGKLAAVVAAGRDVQMDAQRVMFFLSSYGEGDKLGRYVFTSLELVGRGEYEHEVRDITYDKDPANPLGSGIPRETTRKVPMPAIEAEAFGDGVKLDMSGIRLRDAVHLLRDQGWVETTSDGEFGQDCDFSSVKLTAKGREIALTAVKKAMKKGGARFDDDGFAGMPDLFDPGFGGAARETDLQQQTAMLARAKVPFTVEHSADGERTIISINDKPAFVFDAAGALVNTGKDVDEKKDGE